MKIFIKLIAMVLVFNSLLFAQGDMESLNYGVLVKELTKQLKDDSDNIDLKRELSVSYHNYAFQLIEADRWEEAIEKEEQALKLYPQEAKILKKALSVLHNGYGLYLKENKKFNSAVSQLEKALRYAPFEPQLKKNMAIVYLEMAHSYFQKADYFNCRKYLKKALENDSSNAHIYVLSGEVAYNQDDYTLAYNDWVRAIEMDPSLYDIKVKLEKLKHERELERGFRVKEVENFKLKFEGIAAQELAQNAA